MISGILVTLLMLFVRVLIYHFLLFGAIFRNSARINNYDNQASKPKGKFVDAVSVIATDNAVSLIAFSYA